MKYFIYVALFAILSVVIYSCSDDENASESKYSYTQTIEIIDFKLYVGSPEGGKEVSKEYQRTPQEMWGERMTTNHPDEIILTSDKQIQHYSNNKLDKTYTCKFKGDSIFRSNNNYDWWFYGIGTKQRLEYAMAFYRGVKMDDHSSNFSIGQDLGTYSDEEFFNENNIFTSPEDMTDVRDTLAWCNIRFIYERVK